MATEYLISTKTTMEMDSQILVNIFMNVGVENIKQSQSLFPEDDDDDGDGILDGDEDDDGDGIVNDLDLDDNGDGIPDYDFFKGELWTSKNRII